MNVFLVVFGKYGLEYMCCLREEQAMYEEYFMEILRNPKAPKPHSRLHTAMEMIKDKPHRELEAWAYPTELNSDGVWKMFDDLSGAIIEVRKNGTSLEEML